MTPGREVRVVFDARVLGDPALAERGIGRYASSLLAALSTAGRDVVALREPRRPPAPARFSELLEHALLGRDARRSGASVLHSPSIDLATTRPRLPYVVTLHDLVPLKHPERYLRTGLKHRLRYAAVRAATRVIVPTASVASDAERLLGIGPDRIDVIAEAPAAAFRPRPDAHALLARLRLPDRYLLWVGGLDPPDPRKGLEALVAAAAGAGAPPLVLAGRIGPEAAGLIGSPGIVPVGRVTDDELAALYSRADALVFPSEEEGFGLPVVEALACGTAVAAYAIDALREQHHNRRGVALVEPGDAGALLAAAQTVAGTRVDSPKREWSDVAAETWAAYEAALAG